MPSPTLTNLAKRARLVRGSGWDGKYHSNAFSILLMNSDRLDMARSLYYSHDPASLKIFDWRVQYLAASTFYGTPLALRNRKHAPWTSRWKKNTLRFRTS